MTAELVFVPVTVTCHTSGCENRGIPIDTYMSAGGFVECGPCGKRITTIEIREEG